MMTEIKVKLNKNVLGTCNICQNWRTRYSCAEARPSDFWDFLLTAPANDYSLRKFCIHTGTKVIVPSTYCPASRVLWWSWRLEQAVLRLTLPFPDTGWKHLPVLLEHKDAEDAEHPTLAPLLHAHSSCLLWIMTSGLKLESQPRPLSAPKPGAVLQHWAAEASTGGVPFQRPCQCHPSHLLSSQHPWSHSCEQPSQNRH